MAEQCLRLHDDARRAEAALRRAGGGEAIRPSGAFLCRQAFLRDDLLALDTGRLLRARDDGAAVHDHRAGAARPLGRAAVLHRMQPEVLPQELEQALPLAGLDRDCSSVEGEVHLVYSIAPSTSASSAMRMTTPLKASTQ